MECMCVCVSVCVCTRECTYKSMYLHKVKGWSIKGSVKFLSA